MSELSQTPVVSDDQLTREFQVSYDGKAIDLGLILLKNVVLTILTLTLYRFWGRVEMRKFVWSHALVDGNRFRYTGTGAELFFGFIKLVGMYLAFSILSMLVQATGLEVFQLVFGLLTLAGMTLLIPTAIYFGRRYRLSRTMYRNVRFNMTPGLQEVIAVSLKGLLLTILTLGLYWGVYRNQLHRVLTNLSSYGSLPFRYTGEDRAAFIIWLKAIFLVPLTLGIYYPFYRAELMRFHSQHTTIGDVTIQDSISGLALLKIGLFGLFAIPLTFGLATPWVLTYAYRTRLACLSGWGQIDFARVAQTAAHADALGENMVDAFDVALEIG